MAMWALHECCGGPRAREWDAAAANTPCPRLKSHRGIDAGRPHQALRRPCSKIEDITYSVEGRPLFEGASATIPTGHKVGLVGRNGAGKTTLFRLIRGELALEGGAITLPQRARIGGVAQEVPSSDTSLLDTVLQADTERAGLMAEAETAHDAAPDRRDPGPAGRHRRLVGRRPRLGHPQGPGLRCRRSS